MSLNGITPLQRCSLSVLYLLAVLFGDIYRTLVAEQEIKLLLGQFSLQLGSFIPHDLTKIVDGEPAVAEQIFHL